MAAKVDTISYYKVDFFRIKYHNEDTNYQRTYKIYRRGDMIQIDNSFGGFSVPVDMTIELVKALETLKNEYYSFEENKT